jgi:hypothetical protein
MMYVCDYQGDDRKQHDIDFEIGTLVEFLPEYKDEGTAEQQDFAIGMINEIQFRKTRSKSELLYLIGGQYVPQNRITASFARREVERGN